MNIVLLPKFERGQVWENPDGLLMLVKEVREHNEVQKVNFIDEDGCAGSFYSNDHGIIDNCKMVGRGKNDRT